MKLAITGGRVYDPTHGVDGVQRDIFVEGTKVVDALSGPADRSIDASGCIVFPGGVDMHCHIAGPGVERARRLLAGRHAGSPSWTGSGSDLPVVPSAPETARLYAGLGYSTAIDAAISPTASRLAYHEFAAAEGLDTGFLLLLANNALLLDLLRRGEAELAREVVAKLLAQSGAFGIKAVNAGGVTHWKNTGTTHDGANVPVEGLGVSPADILRFLAGCADDFGLPHSLHVHVAKLGLPGNIATTLETSEALGGHRHHIAHASFNIYGKNEDGAFASATEHFTDHLAAHPELSCDVGQLCFADTLTLSGDQEIAHSLWKVTGKPYATLDIECEGGYAMLPIEYRDASRIHALQWAIGMELFLLSPDPWRVVFSTDHPNGAPFLAYPTVMAQLMSADLRREVMERFPEGALRNSVLPDLDREYTLYELATVTRAAPAKLLGLSQKGHIGPGADADIAVYREQDDREAMFRSPETVILGGSIAIDQGRSSEVRGGVTHRVAPASDSEADREVATWFDDHASYRVEQLGPRDEALERSHELSSRS
ncbi:MAG: formylmethanofuran dehydrogenase subunit A [Planctomycetota bacterium]